MTEEIELTKDNFKQEVLDFEGVVLVDFWATWCGPCRAMKPRVDALGVKYADDSRVKIAKLDVDAESELAQQQSIMSMPTFKVFVNGEPVAQKIGLIPPVALEELLLEGINTLAPAAA